MDAPAEAVAAKLAGFLARRQRLSQKILSGVDLVRETARRYAQIAIELLEEQPHERREWVQNVLGSPVR